MLFDQDQDLTLNPPSPNNIDDREYYLILTELEPSDIEFLATFRSFKEIGVLDSKIHKIKLEISGGSK